MSDGDNAQTGGQSKDARPAAPPGPPSELVVGLFIGHRIEHVTSIAARPRRAETFAVTEDPVRLEVEAERSTELLQRTADYYLPLSVASAIAFHQAHGNTKAIVSRQDYNDALNIAAAALSRLVTIYVLRDPHEGRVPLAVDLTRWHFARGATRLQSADEAYSELSVARRELVSALSLIQRTGLAFSFAATKDL